MNNTSPSPELTTPRCSHRSPSGRRCRQLSADAKSGLCLRHLPLKLQSDTADLGKLLLANWEGFQTAQGVNYALTNLYALLAANRISARRAAVLAYINSLLLRTHSAIDADIDAGVKCPEAFTPEKPRPQIRKVDPSKDHQPMLDSTPGIEAQLETATGSAANEHRP